MSYNRIHAEGISYANIAHDSIQEKRANKQVTCGPGGTLHDYVPFYFGHRSPMLYSINRGNVEGYEEGQGPVVHLVTKLTHVKSAGVPYVFSDGHGIKAWVEFFDDDKDLDKIDWPLMRAKYWFDRDEDPNRAFRRQAEFLVRDHFPWEGFAGMLVLNEETKAAAESAMDGADHRPQVLVHPAAYY